MNNSKTDDFIKKSKDIHGSKYDYSKANYKNRDTKICIICHEIDHVTGKEHGEFWQIPYSHLHGMGCPKCGGKIKHRTGKLTQEEFVERARIIHEN